MKWSASTLEEQGFRSPFARVTLSVPGRLHGAFLAEFALGAVAVLGIFAMQRAGVTLAPVAVLPAVWFWFRKQHLWQARLLLVALCTGSDPAVFAYGLVLGGLWTLHTLLIRPAPRARALFVPFGIFVLWCFASAAVSQAREFNFLALPFWCVTVMSSLAIYLYFSRWPLVGREWSRLFLFAIGVALCECVLAYFASIREVGFRSIWSSVTTPDIVVGTLSTTTNFVPVLLQVVTVILAILLIRRPPGAWVLYGAFLVIGIIVYTADVKTFFGAFALGWLVAYIALVGLKLDFRRLAFLGGLAIVGVMFGAVIVSASIEKYETVYAKYLFGEANRKFQFISRAASPDNRGVADYVIGFGPGTCGSRASNMRAYDTLYKDSTSQAQAIMRFFPPFTSEYTRRYIADLWTLDFFLGASSRSALLGNPFNSWAALMFEAGLVGLLLWFWFLRCAYREGREHLRNTEASLVARVGAWALMVNAVAMAVSGIITQTLEMPVVAAPLWFFAMQMHSGGLESPAGTPRAAPAATPMDLDHVG